MTHAAAHPPNSQSAPLPPAARLLAAIGSARVIAGKLGNKVSARAAQNWLAGDVPSRRNRQYLEAVLGIPASAWQPAATAFEAALATSLASVIGEVLRARHAELQPPALAAGEAV